MYWTQCVYIHIYVWKIPKSVNIYLIIIDYNFEPTCKSVLSVHTLVDIHFSTHRWFDPKKMHGYWYQSSGSKVWINLIVLSSDVIGTGCSCRLYVFYLSSQTRMCDIGSVHNPCDSKLVPEGCPVCEKRCIPLNVVTSTAFLQSDTTICSLLFSII